MAATTNLNKFEAHEKFIEDLKAQIDVAFQKMSEISALSATKVKVNAIEKRLNEFASIEHVKTLKEFLMPKLEAFSDKVDDFQNENMNVRECVIAFDKSLSLKANKNDFSMFAENLKKEFLPIKYLSTLDEKIATVDEILKNDLLERQLKFDEFMRDTKLEFDQNMVRQFLEKFKKYEKVEKSFSKFFNSDDLIAVMNNKVDTEMLNEVKQDKASRDELKDAMFLMNDMN